MTEQSLSVSDQTGLELGRLIQSRQLTSEEVTASTLQRIASVDDRVHAFSALFSDRALTDARQADKEIQAGLVRGPLHGVPIAIKDVIDVEGEPTLCNSLARADHVARADAAVIGHLRSAGLVLLGKTVPHEFAYGNTNSPTNNPYDLTRIPSGSSGGSAAALAARECALALGSDTAASVRSPAAVTGVTGLRPTQGRVSTRGVWPVAWSIDTVGPMARSVADIAALLQVIAGFDADDAGTADVPVPDFSREIGRSVAGMTVGVPADYFLDNVQPAVQAAFDVAVAQLVDLGMKRRSIRLPSAAAAPWVFMFICMAEAATAHESLFLERGHLYGADIRKLVQAGQLLLAKDYLKAQQARMKVYREFREALGRCDVIATPTVPAVASVRTSTIEAPVEINGTFEADFWAFCRLTMPMSIAGIPAISVPCGFDQSGLPIGLQLGVGHFQEARLFRIATAFQSTTPWSDRAPIL